MAAVLDEPSAARVAGLLPLELAKARSRSSGCRAPLAWAHSSSLPARLDRRSRQVGHDSTCDAVSWNSALPSSPNSSTSSRTSAHEAIVLAVCIVTPGGSHRVGDEFLRGLK